MAEQLNIYQKLARIRKPVQVLQKDKSGYGYRYTTKEEILSKITGLMDKLGVSLIPHILPGTRSVEPYHYVKTKAAKDGTIYEEHVNEVLVCGDMEFHWVNDGNPEERIIVPWFFIGQQSDASQSQGSGLSYASRYFLLEYFGCARDDDPDKWRSKQREAESQEEKAVTDAIIEQIDTYIQGYLRENPKDNGKIGSFLKKHIKISGKPDTNYFAIQSSVDASNLLSALKETFKIKEE